MKSEPNTPDSRAKTNARARRYRQKNADKFNAYRAEYRQKNREHINKRQRETRSVRPVTASQVEDYNSKRREHYAANRERIIARRKQILESASNREDLKTRANARCVAYRSRNPERLKAQWAKYRARNQESRKAYRRRLEVRRRLSERRRIRKESDANYALVTRLRRRILHAVECSGGRKFASTAALVGCSIEELRAHLESKFQPGMNWSNHGMGGWHIDHKIPCAEFDLRSEFQQLQCFHFSNLQPLWEKQNLSKGARLTEPYQKTLPL